MERESFSDPEIARQLNEGFVCVKVDREERPDVDEIYMGATQLITRSGGWPNSLFLTPDLKPFFAGTYFPAAGRAQAGPASRACFRACAGVAASQGRAAAAGRHGRAGDGAAARAAPAAGSLPGAELAASAQRRSPRASTRAGAASAARRSSLARQPLLPARASRQDRTRGEMLVFTLDAWRAAA
jgi:uncharacterized protein YyaL (SSP411 family)